MGLLGDIRYMLTQSHYKRTTPYVCVCVFADTYSKVCVCNLLWETNAGGMFVSVFDNMYFIPVHVYVGCHCRLFSLSIRLLSERRSSFSCDESINCL